MPAVYKVISTNFIELDYKMKSTVNLGMVYGRLTVVGVAERIKRADRGSIIMWNCACSCGNNIKARTHSLTKGLTTSCGCFRKEVHFKHGLSKHPIKGAYYNAKSRCDNKNNPDWSLYGGRGIECRLGTFPEFAERMLLTWERGLSLDRIDNNGHYEYDNIRWVSQTEQLRNTRINKWYTFKGETLILSEWARKFGMCFGSLKYRVDKWGVEVAFNMLPKIYKPMDRTTSESQAPRLDCILNR